MYSTEYLPTLGSVTCVLDFPHELSEVSSMEVSSTNEMVVKAEDDTYRVKLPVEVTDPLNVVLVNLKKIDDCMTFSVKLPKQERTERDQVVIASKWSCKDLLNKTNLNSTNNKNQFQFCCSECGTVLLDAENYKFLDMPSEYWFELMDFWHCHKPLNKSDVSQNQYSGVLRPPNDTSVIIGGHYLLMNRANSNLVMEDNKVQCFKCKNVVGELTDSMIKLLKWKLKLLTGNHFEEYSHNMIIYNSIIDKINSLAIRKFKFSLNSDCYYLWVLNLNLEVSTDSQVLHNCLKILYYKDSDNSSSKETTFDDYEQFDLVYPEIIQNLIHQLNSVNEALPIASRFLVMNSNKFRISYLPSDS